MIYCEEGGSWSAEVPELRWTGVGCATREEIKQLALEGAAFVLDIDPSRVTLVEVPAADA